MIVRNLTPHPVNVIGESTITYPVDGPAPRVAMGSAERPAIVDQDGNEIPITITWTEEEVTDLPEARDGVLLIVSRMVTDAAPDRADLVCPDGIVRDSAGRIIGCRSLTHPLSRPPAE